MLEARGGMKLKGERDFTGELLGLVEDKVKLKLDDSEVIEIPREKIAKANLAVEF
jgi:ribosome maturation factor RimP